jgi:succinoglycan biosynthesis transport protein ExoP
MPTSPASSKGMDLSLLWDALDHQRATILGFLAAVVLIALVGTKLTTPVYEAVTLLQLMPRAGKEVEVSEVVNFDEAGYLERRDRARTQIQVILSRSVRQEVIERYNAAGFEDLVGTDGAGALKEMMTVGPREDTQLVEVRVEHTDPERAAALANLIADVYQDQNLEARTEAARETRVWLEGQTGTYREDLDAATQALMDFKRSTDLVDIEEKVDDISRRMSELQRALGEATTEQVLLESEIVEHRRLLRTNRYDVLTATFDSPALKALSEQHALVLTESAEVFARYEEKHPAHRQAVERVSRLEGLIAEEVGRLVEGEQARARILERQIERLNEELDAVKAELLEKQRLNDTYVNLKMEEERLRKLYGSLSERGAEVELQARTRLNDVRILDRALPPGHPARPSLPLNMAVALLVGLGGGVGLALLRERLDDTIRSSEQLTALLDVPLLGAMPILPGELPEQARALYAHNNPQSATAEALRSIRAQLHTAPVSKNPKTLVVVAHRRLLITSSLPGEGKTDTAVGLAISFARLGIATLLIDADLHRPRLHTLLNIARGPGLAEVLQGSEDPLELVEPTLVPDLYLLPCGEAVESPNELLSSAEFLAALKQLSGRYPMIIIDTPPVLPVSDALVMAGGMDVLMVVRHGVARADGAVSTLERLRQSGAKVSGVVLNATPIQQSVYEGYYTRPAQTGEPRPG